MIELPDVPSLFVDVDGTLLHWDNYSPGKPVTTQDPNYVYDYTRCTVNGELVQALRIWHVSPRLLYIWSWGGAEHARRASQICNLTADAYLCKPWAYVDDMKEPKIFLSRAKASIHVPVLHVKERSKK